MSKILGSGGFDVRMFGGRGGGAPGRSQIALGDVAVNLSAFWSFDIQFDAVHSEVNSDVNFLTIGEESLGWPDVNVASGVSGRGLDAVAQDYLVTNTNSTISTGDVSWAMGGMLFTGILSGGLQAFFIMADPAGGGVEWMFYTDGAKVECILYDGTTSQIATATLAGALSNSTWYWFMIGYDSANDEVYLQVGASVDRGAQSGAPGSSVNADLHWGYGDPIHSSFVDFAGAYDEVWFIKNHFPTAGEITTLSNSNNGLNWTQFRNEFYGFSDAEFVVVEAPRMIGSYTSPDADWDQYLTLATGLRDDITFQYGAFYPATVLSGYSGFTYESRLALSNDHWSSLTVARIANWGDGSWLGVTARQSLVAETFYALMVDDDAWKLISVQGGAAESSLATGAYTPTVGDVVRLECEGTTIRANIGGVEVASVTDINIASGVTGIIADRLDADVKLGNFRTGSLPVGDLVLAPNGWFYNTMDAADGVLITSDCGAGFTPEVMFNCYFNDALEFHNVDEVHYVEIDFGEFRLFDGIRLYADTSSSIFQCDDVTLSYKLNSGDDWTAIFTNEDLTGPSTGYTPSDQGFRFSPIVARYLRVAINSTEDADNYIAIQEWEFRG